MKFGDLVEKYSEFMDSIGYYSDTSPDTLDKLVTEVVKLLSDTDLKISTAESCTGGLLSQLITSVSGASEVFELGLCTYSDRIKNKMLGVPENILSEYSAVSAETAKAMAENLADISGADICVSVTGIAGPSGGSPDKPVGTVYAGFKTPRGCFVKLLELWKLPCTSRQNIRLYTAVFVFEILKSVISEEYTYE